MSNENTILGDNIKTHTESTFQDIIVLVELLKSDTDKLPSDDRISANKKLSEIIIRSYLGMYLPYLNRDHFECAIIETVEYFIERGYNTDNITISQTGIPNYRFKVKASHGTEGEYYEFYGFKDKETAELYVMVLQWISKHFQKLGL